ncbi:lipopolysaccharide-responsive and beige-like anchor protein [Oncorhynchus keta]|uniref:lipopolysaccharide-responsive and beige-like anchor protein n=1 Tax=Oncorhynchus keta TaxID=8018 RepID=UPI00227C07C9|nr:lipopolysaccharide-responsive and beige-like anchor protein [Oncorhynchus keta]
MEMLKNSVAMQEQVLACKGFLVIGYTLEKSSKVHVTRSVLDIVLAFARYLSNLQNGVLLLKQLCDHILFNPAIWIHAPAKVQLVLYTYLSTEFISTVTIYNAIRRVGTVLQVMHTLKYYYWVVNPQDRSGVTPKGLDGPRPNQKEIHSLRAFLLLFVKQLIMKDYGVKEDELQSILNYLLTMHEDDNLMDVLQLLVALMSEHHGSMVQAFDQRNGVRAIYKLLASNSEGIRVQALKVLGYFLKHLPAKRKSEVMLGHGLFSLLNERLLLHSNQFSMTTYNVLFEILTEQICTQVIHKQHPDPDSNVKIVNPREEVLKVIAALLKNSPLSPESMEVRRVFLSDMIKLFNNSKDNRRSLLQCSVWQDWMLSLCFINPKSSEEQKVTEMVYAIFRILLYHAIKYEWGGWRVWVDTLSITHSKVTFEQHKENLARMFRQYQRLGSEGDAAGIRTISGASRDSEILGQLRTNRDQGEETAPSTVIELTIDPEGVSQNQESPNTTPPSATSASASTPSPPEREGDRSQRGQPPITVSNMLARAEEEEEEELQQVQNQISEDQRGGAGDRAEATPQKTEAKLTGDKVSSKTVEAMAETETATDKTDEAAAASTAETDEATRPETEDAKVAKTETSADAKTSDTDKVVRPQTDGEKGSETHSCKASHVLMSEDSLNEPKEPELAKQPEEQVSAAISACQQGSAVGASVQSVSDQVRPSSTDDSMEESSFVSAAGGEDQEKEEEESRTQPPKMEEIDLDPSAPGTDPTSTEPARQPLESTTSPPTALEAILPPAAVGATVSKSDTSQAVAPAEAPSTKAVQPEAPQASGATEAPSSRTETSPKVATATAVGGRKDSAAEGPGSATKTKEIHIARLDVSSVASDTERLALRRPLHTCMSSLLHLFTDLVSFTFLRANAAAAVPQRPASEQPLRRSTMFRIPEFRCHSTKTVMDFVNSSENVVFVHNTVHLISQVVDNLIMSCGGILPLLSAATSSSHDLENIEPSQGLSVEASVTFLQRLINLVDVLIFASSLNFTEIEAEKNMSSGGILRQSLRLVCAMAVRDCLECQQQSHFKPSQDRARGQQAVHSLMGAAKSMPAQSPVDVVTGRMSPIRDMDRLLQEMDINRLRAVVFRDIEDSKQAQFLALAVVYFISVLMVSKYRDILEPQNDKKLPQRSQSARSADSNAVSGGPDLESSVSLRRRDSGIGDDHSSVAPSEADTTAQGPDAVSEALSTLSSEVRGHRDNPTADARGGKNVKDILRSLVSAPADDIMVDPSLLPPAFLEAAMGNNPNQFRSFDRSVRVAPKKVGGAPSPGSSTPVPSATAAVGAAGDTSQQRCRGFHGRCLPEHHR